MEDSVVWFGEKAKVSSSKLLLSKGSIIFEEDTYALKISDGKLKVKDLPYLSYSLITTADIARWNNGTGGVGIETDPIFVGSGAASITVGMVSNWNTAFGWGNHTGLYSLLAHTHAFADITVKPTTIGGYGITDFNSLGDARWSVLAHTHTFASLTSIPTTLSGYGIIDAYPLSSNPAGYLTSFSEADTLDSVTDRGSVTSNSIAVGILITSEIQLSASNTILDIKSFNGDRAYRFDTTPGNSYVILMNDLLTLPRTIRIPNNDGTFALTSDLSAYQPVDVALTSIAGLGFASTSFLKKTAANTWALDTNTYLTAEVDTLDSVTTRGAITANNITVGDITTTKVITTIIETEGLNTITFNDRSSVPLWIFDTDPGRFLITLDLSNLTTARLIKFPNQDATLATFDDISTYAQPIDAELTSIAGLGVLQGDLIYGSAANTYSKLAKNASATRYLSNTGTTNNPAWAQIDLSDGVTGVLPIANSQTLNQLLTADNVLTESIDFNGTVSAINVFQLGLADGSSATPSFSFSSDPTTGFYFDFAYILGLTNGGTTALTFEYLLDIGLPIKIQQDAGWAAPTGTSSKASFDADWQPTATVLFSALQTQEIIDNVTEIRQFVKAIWEAQNNANVLIP